MAIAAWAFERADCVPFDAIVILAIMPVLKDPAPVPETAALGDRLNTVFKRHGGHAWPRRGGGHRHRPGHGDHPRMAIRIAGDLGIAWGAIALTLLLQVAVVELPFMNDAFSPTPLTLGDWGVCVALAGIVLWADELRRLAARRSRPAAAPAGA